MINKERIVPVKRIDLLTLYGTILNIANVSYNVLASTDVEGNFTVSANGTFLGNQPVKTLDFAETATAATVYFVADLNGAKVKINGVDTGMFVSPTDAAGLIKCELSGGQVVITDISPD